MFSRIKSIGLFGMNAFVVDVEIDINRGLPSFSIVGLPDAAVRESRERVRAALRACSIELPPSAIMVNLAPAGTKKSGPMHDMAILIAIVKTLNLVVTNLDDCAFVGEVSLNGEIRAIDGVLPMAIKAREMGIKKFFVPEENAFEASALDGIEVYGIKNAVQLIDFLCGQISLEPQERYIPVTENYDRSLDFCDVKGQKWAKKALEIAAAGGHNVLMIGSPGSGKSMLAERIPSILPPLTFEESLETTNIYSISGKLDRKTPLITKRPFRMPHHIISDVGLIGGGTIPHPGELSLAHNGVLFLDELAEFKSKSMEAMRQPLENGFITIAREAGTITYPCSIMLVGAMNPCPCGYYGHPSRKCICSQKQITSYTSRVSGPMIDRIDLHVEVAPVSFEDMSSNNREETSAEIRERVIRARNIQTERFRGTNVKCNAHMSPRNISEYCYISESTKEKFKELFEKLNMSGRGYDKILKVSRTIADLEGVEDISEKHILQAVQYRSLDRKYWLA